MRNADVASLIRNQTNDLAHNTTTTEYPIRKRDKRFDCFSFHSCAWFSFPPHDHHPSLYCRRRLLRDTWQWLMNGRRKTKLIHYTIWMALSFSSHPRASFVTWGWDWQQQQRSEWNKWNQIILTEWKKERKTFPFHSEKKSNFHSRTFIIIS